MGKAESNLAWAPLKRELDERRWIYLRIEHKNYPGVPDLNVHMPLAGDAWVELKYVPETPAKIENKIEIGLEREQFIWLRDNKKAGRKCYLLARVGNFWYLWDDAASWELAKHSTPWNLLLRKSMSFRNVQSIIDHLNRS